MGAPQEWRGARAPTRREEEELVCWSQVVNCDSNIGQALAVALLWRQWRVQRVVGHSCRRNQIHVKEMRSDKDFSGPDCIGMTGNARWTQYTGGPRNLPGGYTMDPNPPSQEDIQDKPKSWMLKSVTAPLTLSSKTDVPPCLVSLVP